jgi:tRNA threonylcarbamoyladenosine dehydratase
MRILLLAVLVLPTLPSEALVTSKSLRFRSPSFNPSLFSANECCLETLESTKIDAVKANRRLRFAGIGNLYSDAPTTSNGDALSENSSCSAPWLVLERLKAASVAVVGVGGVGSWAAEALCRSGIGSLVLVDLDDICISNTNRQLHALSSTVGVLKIDEMKRRLLDINPDCNITLIHDFVSTENVHDIVGGLHLTALIDAMDGSEDKAALLAACTDLSIPVVSCGGSAGRRDPTQIRCDDITRITGDRLLRTCRKMLRRDHGFTEGIPFRLQRKVGSRKVKKWRIECVYSAEEQKQLPRGGEDVSSLRRCDGALGTACFVTGTYGFVAAGRIVDMIAEDSLQPPRRS